MGAGDDGGKGLAWGCGGQVGLPPRPALCGIHKVADAFGGGRIGQASENDAGGNDWREQRLVVAAPGHDDREIRELLVHPVDEGARVAVGGRRVYQEHWVAGGDDQFLGMRYVVGAPDAMHAGERIAQQINQRAIRRQHDDVRARGPRGCRRRHGLWRS